MRDENKPRKNGDSHSKRYTIFHALFETLKEPYCYRKWYGPETDAEMLSLIPEITMSPKEHVEEGLTWGWSLLASEKGLAWFESLDTEKDVKMLRVNTVIAWTLAYRQYEKTLEERIFGNTTLGEMCLKLNLAGTTELKPKEIAAALDMPYMATYKEIVPKLKKRLPKLRSLKILRMKKAKKKRKEAQNC